MNQGNQLIAIVGGSGSGKTWLADRLQTALGATAARLTLDDFYLDRSTLPPEARAKINFDHPDAVDWPLFERALRYAYAGIPVRVPRYYFAAHARRPQWEIFQPAPFVLVDGLWLLWRPHLRRVFAVKIFLDCPAALRLNRRIARDTAVRGRTPAAVREQFQRHVAPMHEQFVAPQARWADRVLPQPLDPARLDELVEWVCAGAPPETLSLSKPRLKTAGRPAGARPVARRPIARSSSFAGRMPAAPAKSRAAAPNAPRRETLTV